MPVVEILERVLPLQLQGQAVCACARLLHQRGHAPRLTGLTAVRLVALPEAPRIALHVTCMAHQA